MAGWNHTNTVWKEKQCSFCETLFMPTSPSQKYCAAECRKGSSRQRGKNTTEGQYTKINGNWSRYMSRLLYFGGRKRDRLTRDTLLAQLEKQNYICALTGIPLTGTLELGVRCPTNASVDRINAGGPYSADNIQLVCAAVNRWRSDLPVGDFINWCRLVVAHHDKERN